MTARAHCTNCGVFGPVNMRFADVGTIRSRPVYWCQDHDPGADTTTCERCGLPGHEKSACTHLAGCIYPIGRCTCDVSPVTAKCDRAGGTHRFAKSERRCECGDARLREQRWEVDPAPMPGDVVVDGQTPVRHADLEVLTRPRESYTVARRGYVVMRAGMKINGQTPDVPIGAHVDIEAGSILTVDDR